MVALFYGQDTIQRVNEQARQVKAMRRASVRAGVAGARCTA